VTTDKVIQGSAAEHGVLDKATLHGAWTVGQTIKADFAHSRGDLLIGSSSPLDLWDDNEHSLLSDPSPLSTLNSFSKNPDPQWTPSQLPLSFTNAFAYRSSTPSLALHRADYLVYTFYMRDTPSVHADFLSTVNRSVQHSGRLIPSPSSAQRHLLLKRGPPPPVRPLSTFSEDALILAGYVAVGFYVYLTLRRIDRVHSRTGLVLTGLTQMFASGLVSLSACKLAGVQFSLVPWKLIPFLILVLGVDNNFMLVNAVSATPVHLSIRDRIGQGLGAVGLELLSALVIEVSLLSACIAMVGMGSLRELLLFALVALFADYALQCTFFLTVLSIDIQRLEVRTSPLLPVTVA
jgi:hypothetical protein